MNAASLVLGGGCFWCLDAAYRLLPGVTGVTCGYAGGHQDNPTYRQVCDGRTGHAEVVKIDYDPVQVSRDKLLSYFWKVHDPTQVGGQGNDLGSQYRSVLFHGSPEDKTAEEASLKEAQGRFRKPITTEILPLPRFWPAEEYHQDYFRRNPGQGYCVAVIAPKIDHLREIVAAAPL